MKILSNQSDLAFEASNNIFFLLCEKLFPLLLSITESA